VSWSLSASGHSPDLADEKRLAEALGRVLADAGPAVSGASFGGGGFTGDPRQLAATEGADSP